MIEILFLLLCIFRVSRKLILSIFLQESFWIIGPTSDQPFKIHVRRRLGNQTGQVQVEKSELGVKEKVCQGPWGRVDSQPRDHLVEIVELKAREQCLETIF